jgi:plastocyanin
MAPHRVTYVAFALALLLAACSSGASSPSAAPASSAAPAVGASAGASTLTGGSPAGSAQAVTIQGFAFDPSSLSVPVGATVTWTNQDSAQHTVTADDGSFDGGPLSTSQGFSQAFSKAGTFTYHCKIHPKMTASVIVK